MDVPRAVAGARGHCIEHRRVFFRKVGFWGVSCKRGGFGAGALKKPQGRSIEHRRVSFRRVGFWRGCFKRGGFCRGALKRPSRAQRGI